MHRVVIPLLLLNPSLSKSENMPQQWLKDPTREQVEVFSKKIDTNEKLAKNVKNSLIDDWIKEVVGECEKPVCPVAKLNYLRKTRDNVWPCPACPGLGRNSLRYFEF